MGLQFTSRLCCSENSIERTVADCFAEIALLCNSSMIKSMTVLSGVTTTPVIPALLLGPARYIMWMGKSSYSQVTIVSPHLDQWRSVRAVRTPAGKYCTFLGTSSHFGNKSIYTHQDHLTTHIFFVLRP